MNGTVEMGWSGPATRAWLDNLDQMEWKEAARDEDIAASSTLSWKPSTTYKICACCGKQFDLYTAQDDWAWRVSTGKYAKYCCSYSCMKRLDEEWRATKRERTIAARHRRGDCRDKDSFAKKNI